MRVVKVRGLRKVFEEAEFTVLMPDKLASDAITRKRGIYIESETMGACRLDILDDHPLSDRNRSNPFHQRRWRGRRTC